MPIDVAADLKPPDGKVATLLANLDIFYKLLTQPAEENPAPNYLNYFLISLSLTIYHFYILLRD